MAGQEVEFSGPQDALVLGINAVHQEVVLCPHLTVAANIFLGDETTRFGLLRKRNDQSAPRRSSTSWASTCRPTRC